MSHIPLILSIGKSTQDVFLRAATAFAPYEHKGVFYEQLPLGQKLDLDEVVMATGGNVTNAAVTFARQGLHAKYAWVLGTDVISEGILRELDSEGIDTSSVIQRPEWKASYSTILLATTGERTILNYHGSLLPEGGGPFDFSVIEGADWVYLSALGNIDLLEKIVTLAKEHGVKVFLNPAGAELSHQGLLRSILEDVAVLAVNKEEAAQIVEGGSSEELARHLSSIVPVAVVSDGPNGVVVTDGKTVVSAGMYEDVPVVDRSGAGDAFGSGFLSKYAIGASLEEAITFASANSTSVVTQIGAKAGILHHGAELHDMDLETKPF